MLTYLEEHLCERCMLTVVSDSSPAHGHGVRSLQSQGPGHCDCDCSEVMLFTA